jgi:hypothetical protein
MLISSTDLLGTAGLAQVGWFEIAEACLEDES